jgi:hypothetical protein
MAIERTSVARIGGLKEEVKLFLTEENPTLADLFHTENWLWVYRRVSCYGYLRLKKSGNMTSLS